MADSVSLGFNGLEAQPGTHICGIYAGERQLNEIVLPFLETGLRAGDKCICIVDSVEPTQILASLDPDLEPRHRADVSQLVVMRASHVFCRSGRFSADETIGLWKVAVSEAMYDRRFEMVRAVNTWSQHDVVVNPEEHLSLESELNRVMPLYRQVMLCLYDLEAFGGTLIFDLLRTHSRLLLGGMFLENPYYMTPEEVMAETAASPGSSGFLEEAIAGAQP
jgi:MEDS: MEthanogen/methylotroph, DcmR Sensory domain